MNHSIVFRISLDVGAIVLGFFFETTLLTQAHVQLEFYLFLKYRYYKHKDLKPYYTRRNVDVILFLDSAPNKYVYTGFTDASGSTFMFQLLMKQPFVSLSPVIKLWK